MTGKKLLSVLAGSAILLFAISASVFATSTSTEETSTIESITLNHDGDGEISWTAVGNSPKGFKVVYGLSPNPTYPTRDSDKYQYLSDPSASSATLDAFDGSGDYYVRVCEYLGGSCGVYSNELTVTLESSKTSSEDKEFEDVPSDHTNADAIEYLKDTGVVEGYSDGTYKPAQDINRAEFLKIIIILAGVDYQNNSNCFKDVTSEWYAPYVCSAKNMGLVEGYSDGYFRPDRTINFAEASKIVVIAFGLEPDEELNEEWYQKYVVALEEVGAIPVSIMSFDKLITRGEMAEMGYRVETGENTDESTSYTGIKTGEEPEKEETSTEDPVTEISLSVDDTGKATWSSDGYSDLGYKVVWSLTSGPTYPTRSGDKYQYYSSPDATSHQLTAFDGDGMYYVRVCEYLGGECGVYSNEVTVTLTGEETTEEPDSSVTSITLTAEEDALVSWTYEGTSDQGFKVVYGLTSEPTYPTRESDKYQYFSDTSVDSATIDAWDGEGVYYVRVCEYLGGECGTYSNEVEIDLSAEEETAAVNSISLAAMTNQDKVFWTTDGYSEFGYKVIYSLNPDPEYPPREGDEYQYHSDPAIGDSEIYPFDGNGTYYIRVCEALENGECGVYSNTAIKEM